MVPNWHTKASCVGLDPKLFHPKARGGRRPNIKAPLPAQVVTAKRVCAECPVTEDCLEAGVGAPGIWGGLEEYERRPEGLRDSSRSWTPLHVRGDIDRAMVGSAGVK